MKNFSFFLLRAVNFYAFYTIFLCVFAPLRDFIARKDAKAQSTK